MTPHACSLIPELTQDCDSGRADILERLADRELENLGPVREFDGGTIELIQGHRQAEAEYAQCRGEPLHGDTGRLPQCTKTELVGHRGLEVLAEIFGAVVREHITQVEEEAYPRTGLPFLR